MFLGKIDPIRIGYFCTARNVVKNWQEFIWKKDYNTFSPCTVCCFILFKVLHLATKRIIKVRKIVVDEQTRSIRPAFYLLGMQPLRMRTVWHFACHSVWYRRHDVNILKLHGNACDLYLSSDVWPNLAMTIYRGYATVRRFPFNSFPQGTWVSGRVMQMKEYVPDVTSHRVCPLPSLFFLCLSP